MYLKGCKGKLKKKSGHKADLVTPGSAGAEAPTATLGSQPCGPWWAPAPPNHRGASQTLRKTPSAETKQGPSEVTTWDPGEAVYKVDSGDRTGAPGDAHSRAAGARETLSCAGVSSP